MSTESDWSTIWEVVPPDVKTMFEEKLGSRPARKMASRARLVCSSWAANLSFPTLAFSGAQFSRAGSTLLDGAKKLSWVRPPRNLTGLPCMKKLTSLSLNYLVLIFDPQSHETSLMLSDLLRSEAACPALLERLSIIYCTLKAEEFEHVGRLRALKRLCLSDSTLDDGALRYISCLTGLEALDISGNSQVTDAGMPSLPRGLTELNLSQCNVSDAGLPFLPKMLTSLNLNICHRITDAGLVHIAHIATLKLNYCRGITGADLGVLRDVCSLSVAQLVKEFKLCGITSLRRLSSLDVYGPYIEEPIAIPTLTSLDFRCGSGLALMRLPALVRLCVIGSGVSVDDLKLFAGTLTSLVVEASQITPEIGENLPGVTSMKLLVSDFFCKVDFSLIKSHFPALTSLDVTGLGIKDDDLRHLGHLSSLNLSFCQSITSAGLSHLTGLSSVRLVSCPGVKDKMAIEELWKTVKNVEF
jgi:Leucine-rich repeat (LRR) protein